MAELQASFSKPAPSSQASIGNSEAFICEQSSFSAATWSLQDSWILDNRTNIHVCNSTMLPRFTKTRSSGPEDTLRAGSQILSIESYGTIDIFINTPIGCQTITLLNVAYVSDFMTNLVSMSILTSKRVYFDTKEMHFYRDSGTMAYVENYNGHHLMENNTETKGESASAGFATSKTRSIQDWHQVLGHASHNAIKHLEEVTDGIKVFDKNAGQVPKTNKCETCALSKSHRIVSQSPDKSKYLDKPFHRVTYDFMQFTTALNQDQWVSHFACASTDFNMVYTHSKKSHATAVIKEALNVIEMRYRGKMVFFRSDGEKTLGIEFSDFISEKEITHETSALDTPAQNGHSERKGAILAMKAKAMRIKTGLPIYLWYELMRTAGYIANRTSMEKYDWKTPFEKVTASRPNLSHLRKIGCKAYALDKDIPRKQKLQERAHIGHLVGYDSTNIYRIWIPSQHKVICTRDIIFDKQSFYSSSDLDLSQITLEPMLDLLYDVTLLETATQIVEIESDSEEELSVDIDQTRDVPLPKPPIQKGSRADEVSADFDESNILPEGATRRRKKKQAYAVALHQSSQGHLNSFHSAFSAFVTSESQRYHRDTLPAEPKSYQKMLKHPHAKGFQQAMQTEMEALLKRNTWREVPLGDAFKEGKVPIPTTWLFKYKFDEQGFLLKYKARLVARGDLQHTEQDTFAATLAARIFRSLMALVAAFDLETQQYDVVNAFPNTPIDEPTYCKTPDEWTGSDLILLLLLRALYGLKQSPALWYKHFSRSLLELGLEPISRVECLFMNNYLLLFFFVDDIVVLYQAEHATQVDEFQAKLFKAYKMRHLGKLEWFLGIHITKSRATCQLWLCQDSYIDKLSVKFNISTEGKKHPKTPLPCGELTKSTTQAIPQEIYAYQQRIGSINFAAVITRPDVAHCASQLSQFLTNLSQHHIDCANKAFLYLAFEKKPAIMFDGQAFNLCTVFLASSDASYGNDLDTRQSSQGYRFLLFNGMINWKASKQKTVTTSSTEAELLAISSAAKESIWWSRFLTVLVLTRDTRHTFSVIMLKLFGRS